MRVTAWNRAKSVVPAPASVGFNFTSRWWISFQTGLIAYRVLLHSSFLTFILNAPWQSVEQSRNFQRRSMTLKCRSRRRSGGRGYCRALKCPVYDTD